MMSINIPIKSSRLINQDISQDFGADEAGLFGRITVKSLYIQTKP